MAHPIVVPRLGWSMEEGTFVRWLKHDGEIVRRGEALFELESEKALQEIEAVDDGVLRIPPDAPQAGSVVLVGKILGYLVAEGEPIPWHSITATQRLNSPADATQPSVDSPPDRESSTLCDAPISRSMGERRHVTSPRARRIAKEQGIDWTRLTGSGARGRVRERDVRAAADAEPRPGARLPISKRRRAVADHLLVSRLRTVPVTLTTRADATQLVILREQFPSVGETTVTPSYQDFIIKLVAEALLRYPILAGRWDDDAIVLPAADGIHIGMAVDTDDGLLVPVIHDVRGLSLTQLAATTRQLIGRARGGKLSAGDLQGSVFTVTNLGAFGIDVFTPTINYPEAAILGLGDIRREPVVLDDGQIVARHQLTLSLTFDHRIVDGAPAARFLQDLVGAIANPSSWLLKA